MLDKLQKAATANADFVEIRAFFGNSTRVRLREREVEEASFGSSSGVGVRVLDNGAWGFAYTSVESKLWETVLRAIKLARATSKKPIGAELAHVEPACAKLSVKVKKHPADYGLDEKVALCREMVPEPPKGIVTYDMNYSDGWGMSYYVNSEGAAIEYSPVRSIFGFTAYSKKNGELLRAYERDGALKGVELLDKKRPLLRKAFSNALLLQRSKLPPKGKQTVIIDPKMAGVFAHEMVGHACEGDTIANEKSVLGDKLGRLLGSRHVSISDDPTLPGLFGSYPYDAEGTKARKTKLVENGRIVGFMNSRESAARLGMEPTGNSRAESAAHFPIVRMSNTFFEPGDRHVGELFEGIDGIYVHGMKGGVTEPNTGYFQFAAEYGYLVENGEKTAPLRDITLVGHIIKTLRAVDAAADDFTVGHPGFCGKAGQTAFVSDGGPHIRIKEVLVG